jgi:proteasome beta subunit
MSYRFQSLPGATTVGLVCKDGVILASESRYSYGYFIVSNTAKKVFKITENIGAACAGLVGDMQVLMKEAAIYSSIYTHERERDVSVRSAAKIMGNLLFQRKFIPYITQTIVGGVDEEGPSLFVLDLMGSVIDDKYATVGSGAEVAVGVFESDYRDDLSIDEGRDIAIKALKASLARDAASGGNLDIMTVTKEGIKEEIIKVE